MNVDTTKRGPSPQSSLTALAGRTFDAVPPPALVLLGIVSVQLGAALAKHLFSAVGSFGTVALRLFFAAAVLMLLWRPTLRMNRHTWAVVLRYGVILGLMN
jgi:inner membrane transporter RhtA